jgi:hypothetical protein
VGSAILLTLVVLTIYGGHTVMPSFHEFNRAVQSTPIGDVELSVGALHQMRLQHTPPGEYLSRFWESFTRSEAKWKMHLSLMTGSAAVAGLVFGSLAPMFSSALWTSTIGTILLAVSVITGSMTADPASEQNYLAHTDWVGWTLLFGIATSTWLQWRTLKKPKKKPAAPGGGGGGGGGGASS